MSNWFAYGSRRAREPGTYAEPGTCTESGAYTKPGAHPYLPGPRSYTKPGLTSAG